MNATTWSALRRQYRQHLGGLRAGIYASGGSPFHHAALLALWGVYPTPISGPDIAAGGLERLDVLVVPGGGVRAMTGLLEPLGEDGAAAIRDWVEAGGMYIGSCAGSFLPARVGASFWRDNPQARTMCMVNARLFNSDDSEWAGLSSPGVGTVTVEVARPRHWLARDLPQLFRLVHYNGPMFDCGDADTLDDRALAATTGVVRFRSATEDFTPGEAFMGPRPARSLFAKGAEGGSYSAIAADYGQGTVVLFGSHPEFGLDSIQLGWDDGVRLFGNALSRQAARRTPAPTPDPSEPDGDAASLRRGLAEAATRLERLAAAFAALHEDDIVARLDPAELPHFLGLTPAELWRAATADAARAGEVAAQSLRRWLDGEIVPGARLRRWLEEPGAPDQDYGFVGLRPLLGAVEARLERARMHAAGPFPALQGPYDAMDRHPYQLVASSYLSAAGLMASALLGVTVLGSLLGDELDTPQLLEVLLATPVATVS